MSDALAPGEAPVPEKVPENKTSRHDELVGEIRDLIFDGELAPGARVPERVLCERFGISRTPLREAMKALASEGLLELMPNRGARVAALNEAAVDEMFPVIAALEALAGELACQNLTDEGFAEIQALHYQMVLHFTRRELLPYFQVNQSIHEKILDAARNPLLAQMYRGLSGRIRRARYVANMSADRWQQAVDEHEEILHALAHRDGPRLADVLKRHLRNKCDTVKAHLGTSTNPVVSPPEPGSDK